MKLKRTLSSLFVLVLALCIASWADDDNHGTDHSKGHSNDSKECKKPKPPNPPPPPHNPPPKGGNGGNGGNSSSSSNQTQTQSQSATAISSSSASNNGNGSNDNTTIVAAPKIPVSTAYAPNAYPTVPCFKGYSGGVQTMAVGVSGGGGKVDKGCDAREEARTYMLMGSRRAACKVLVFGEKNQKLTKKHPEQAVTMDDCMYEEPQPVQPAPPAPVQIVVPSNTPIAAVAPTPAPVVVEALPAPPTAMVASVDVEHLVGVCTFSKAISCTSQGGPHAGVGIITVNSICRQMLDEARRQLRLNPNSVLVIRGNANASENRQTASSRANNVKRALTNSGVTPDRLKVEAGNGTSRTVELVLVPKA